MPRLGAPDRLVEIENFFTTYKLLEKKETDVVGWCDLDRALEVLASDRAARDREGAVASEATEADEDGRS